MGKYKRINTKIVYAVAVVIGMGIGLFLIQKPKGAESSELSPMPKSFKAVKQESSKARNANSSSIEQHIVTAQTLLSRAIELSKEIQENPDLKSRIKENNNKIVELVNQAIDATNQAVSLNPNDPRGYTQRAKIYQTISKYMPEANQQAVANYKMAVKLNPSNAEYCEQLADLLLASISHQPEPENTTRHSEFSSESTGQTADSSPAIPNQVRDDSGGTRDDNSGVQDDSGEKLKQAVYYLQMAVEANPTDPNLLKKLAEVKTQAGYIKSARNDYQQLIGLLTQKEQKEAIKAEIDSLNKLLAEASNNRHSELDSESESPGSNSSSAIPTLRDDQGQIRDDIVLPEEPPKLQASHLADSNTVIAAPEENESTVNSQQLNSNALSGTSVIPAGEKKVKICNNNLSPETQVYLTLGRRFDQTNQILFVKSKAPYNPETEDCAHFVAATAKLTSQDLKFRFLIIEE